VGKLAEKTQKMRQSLSLAPPSTLTSSFRIDSDGGQAGNQIGDLIEFLPPTYPPYESMPLSWSENIESL